MRTASWRTKACVAVDRLCGMLAFVVVGRGEIGLTCRKLAFKMLRNSEGSGRELGGDGVKNSPGNRRVELRSCLRAVLRMRGRVVIHASGLGCAFKAAFSWR